MAKLNLAFLLGQLSFVLHVLLQMDKQVRVRFLDFLFQRKSQLIQTRIQGVVSDWEFTETKDLKHSRMWFATPLILYGKRRSRCPYSMVRTHRVFGTFDVTRIDKKRISVVAIQSSFSVSRASVRIFVKILIIGRWFLVHFYVLVDNITEVSQFVYTQKPKDLWIRYSHGHLNMKIPCFVVLLTSMRRQCLLPMTKWACSLRHVCFQ